MKLRTITLLALLAMPFVHAEEIAIDPVSGLKKTGDWELIRNNCSACHSTRLITQQSGDAEQWLGLIRWMQEEQNLWQFDADTEDRIISYLAENYPPRAQQRRAPIAADMMPPKHHGGHGRRGGGCGCKHGGKHENKDCGCAESPAE